MKKLALLLALCLAVTMLSGAALAEDSELYMADPEVGEAQGETGAPGLVAEPEGDSDAEAFDEALPEAWNAADEAPEVGAEEEQTPAVEDEAFAVEALPEEDLGEAADAAAPDAADFGAEPQAVEAAGEEGAAEPAVEAEAAAAVPHTDPNGPQLAANEITLGVGEAFELNGQLPEGVAGEIIYVSADAAIASVTPEGVVGAAAPGDVCVTATAADGSYAECFVHVKQAPDAVAFSAKKFAIGKGETTDALKVLVGSVPGEYAGACSFSTSNKKIVAIDANGAIKGVKAGKATVKVTTYNGKTSKCVVTVAKAPGKVTASADRATLGVGETGAISYALPKGTASQMTFTSEDPSVLAVDAATGVTQAVAAGETRVRVAAFNGKKAYVSFKVLPAPESVAFGAESIRLAVGMKQTVAAAVNGGSAGAISYAVQDGGVASCNKDGVLKGAAKGETLLTATTYNGLTAQIAVSVVDAPSKVTLPYKTLDIGVKQKVRLEPSVGDSASTFTYATSNKKIVKVDGDGVITGVKKGTATITVKTFNKKSVKLKVNVVKAPGSVTISPASAEIGVGETAQFTASMPKGTASGVTYSSSAAAIASVDAQTGVVTGVAPGSAVITVKTSNGKKSKATVTVTSLPEWIEVENGLAELAVGQSLALSVKMTPGSRSPLWYSSSDTGVAVVDGSGVVTGVASGQATITVDTGIPGVSAQAIVTVWPAPESVSLETTVLTLNVGETTQMVPSVTEGTVTAYTYASSDSSVAEVSETGAVTAVSKGSATLSVTTHNGRKAEFYLTVLDPWYPDKVKLTNAPKTLAKDETLQLNWTVSPEGAAADLVWESSNESAVTVDSQGLLKAVGYGSATITAKSRRNKDITLDFKVEVVIDGLVLEIPKRTTDIDGIAENLAKIEAIRLASVEQIKALKASGTITGADAKKRTSIVNNAFKDYAFPWMTPSLQKYWRAANSEGGAKDFKADRVYYGMPYISGSGKNRQYNAAKALKEGRFTDSGEGYYLLNKKNLLSGRYVGNDCSCFVDAAIWGTNSSHSADRTSDIAKSSAYKTIKDIKAMRTGDLICKGYAHVVMFLYYTDAEKTQAMIIENGGIEPGTNTVHCIIMDLSYYTKNGYSVKRLKSLG